MGFASTRALIWKGTVDAVTALIPTTQAIAAGKVSAALFAGAAVGMGLEKGQQALVGTSLSEELGDRTFEAWGPAQASAIDWFDKYFGWLP